MSSEVTSDKIHFSHRHKVDGNPCLSQRITPDGNVGRSVLRKMGKEKEL